MKTDYKKYLEPETIAKLDNIELKARLVVEGFITGLHKSPYHGFSVEFAEHRQYRPGDETRHIDWKVFARTNRYYVKEFEEETNLRCNIVLDKSGSMAYTSKGNIPKFEYAIYLAAAIAYMLINQRDATGLALYDTEIETYLPPKSKASYIHEILRTLARTETSNETGTAKALDGLAERIKRRGLVVIMSDFFDEPESILNAIRHFRHKNHDLIVFHILDPREIDFELGSGATFRDLETKEELLTLPYHIQKEYKQTMEEFIEQIKRQCVKNNVDYNLIVTSDSFDKPLREFIAKRNKVR
ncbi:MAG: DUF58 domain-containing protein [Ignavibacteria bacterium]|nr:DUF58 domain-containing protein [Ignavibacteria bacterium]